VTTFERFRILIRSAPAWTGPTALLFATCFAHAAVADDAARMAVLDNLQASFSVCAAFYTIETSCAPAAESRLRLTIVSKRSEALASAIPLSAADVALRLELNLAGQRSLMGNGCDGVATLQNRYRVECDPFSSGSE
jgi:hypothetical protein